MDFEGQDEIDAYNASQAVYGSNKHHEDLLAEGYIQDFELSNDATRIYTKPTQTIVTYKGTNPISFTDLDADVAIGLGTHRYHPEFAKASDTAKKAKAKYQNKIITTGHSLGGTKAIESANDIGAKAVAFNPGTGVFGLKTKDHKVYVHEKDKIASRVRGSNVTKIRGGSKYKPLENHSINTFEETFKRKSIGRTPRSKGVGKRTRK